MYIGIDIGGTNTRVAGNKSLDSISLAGSRIIKTAKYFGDGIVEIIDSIRGVSDVPEGIGVGIAGRVSDDGRSFTHSTNLAPWTNQPILERLGDEFGCSAYMTNDAVAQSLGEAYFGTQPANDFLYLVWGTGLGGAIVSIKSGSISATKLDHQYRGRWEKLYGGNNIETRFGRPANKLDENEWNLIMSDFADSLQDLSSQLDLNTIVIGGGIVEKQKQRISTIVEELQSPKVILSTLGEDIGVIGSLALIKNKR